jgi:thioredoxin 1
MEDSVIEHVEEWDVYQNKVNSGPCIVKATARWCRPCALISPTFTKLANQHHDKITFIEIDIDKADEISTFENIRSIPLFLFYDKGHQYKELTTLGGNSAVLEANVAKFVELLNTQPEPVIITSTTTSTLSNLADDDINESSSEDEAIPELDVEPEALRTLAVNEEHNECEKSVNDESVNEGTINEGTINEGTVNEGTDPIEDRETEPEEIQ